MTYIIYRSYACLINIFNSYIFNSFLKRGLFLCDFIFIQFSLRILNKLKTKFFLHDFLLLCGTIYRVKKKLEALTGDLRNRRESTRACFSTLLSISNAIVHIEHKHLSKRVELSLRLLLFEISTQKKFLEIFKYFQFFQYFSFYTSFTSFTFLLLLFLIYLCLFPSYFCNSIFHSFSFSFFVLFLVSFYFFFFIFLFSLLFLHSFYIILYSFFNMETCDKMKRKRKFVEA